MDLQQEQRFRQVSLMQAAQRCKATSKRSGKPCKAPAVKGWTVCHYHGTGGGAPKGKANGTWKHGEAIAARAIAGAARSVRRKKYLISICWKVTMAEGVGFEPTVSVNPRRFSRPVP